MKKLPDWLEQKFVEWEKSEGSRQTYYSFARYLDVGHSALALWISGTGVPQGDDLAKVASKLGAEIYEIVNVASPSTPLATISANFHLLPAAFQARLASATAETAQAIAQDKLDPESIDAKRIAVRVFEKWGLKVSG
jgi:hypothetical protein